MPKKTAGSHQLRTCKNMFHLFSSEGADLHQLQPCSPLCPAWCGNGPGVCRFTGRIFVRYKGFSLKFMSLACQSRFLSTWNLQMKTTANEQRHGYQSPEIMSDFHYLPMRRGCLATYALESRTSLGLLPLRVLRKSPSRRHVSSELAACRGASPATDETGSSDLETSVLHEEPVECPLCTCSAHSCRQDLAANAGFRTMLAYPKPPARSGRQCQNLHFRSGTPSLHPCGASPVPSARPRSGSRCNILGSQSWGYPNAWCFAGMCLYDLYVCVLICV